MDDIDASLALLENKVRRAILERLVREPHYPLQLSKQIGVSQQAIMKHLKLLEHSGMIDSSKVPSEIGGPPKKIYSVQKSFSLRIDLGPDLFKIEKRKLPKGGPMRISNQLPKEAISIAEVVSGRKKIPIDEAANLLDILNKSIEKIDTQRDAIIAMHQHIMNKVSSSIDFDEYDERFLVHSILEKPNQMLDLNLLAEELQLGAQRVEGLFENVNKRIMKRIAQRSGSIIATSESHGLPWWTLLEPESKSDSRSNR